MKRKLLFAAMFIAGALGTLRAQTSWAGDITSDSGLDFSERTAFPEPNSSLTVPEVWCNDASAAFNFKQSLTDIPDGVYELSVNAMYRASLTYGTETNCVLYATVGENTYSTPIANFGNFNAIENRAGAKGRIAEQIEVMNAYNNNVNVFVEGGNATIGMKSTGSLTRCTDGYWFVWKRSTFSFKDVTSTYHAKLVARATTMLTSAPESEEKTTLNNALTTYADANFANVKALQTAINTFLETATVAAPLNVTGYITNPSFEDNSGNKKNWIQDLGYKQCSAIYQPTGWNMLYSSAVVKNTEFQTYQTQTAEAKDGYCYYVRHKWADVKAVVSLHQLVKELPTGAYQLTVAVKGGSEVTDANTLTMVAGANSNTTTVNDFDKTNYKDYSVQVIKADADTDIDISFGWNQTSSGNIEQLYYVDDFRLYYLGDPVKVKKAELEALQATINDENYLTNAAYTNVVGTERTNLVSAKTATAAEETVESYEAAISSVQGTIDAFTAARANYDALVAEIARAKALGIEAATVDGYAATTSSTAATALASTQALKVAEYNYVSENYSHGVELGTWITTGPTGSLTTQHWSGEARPYLEQSSAAWGQTSWTIKYEQDLTLPAGNYVFKVAGRQADSDGVTLNLEVKKGDETLGTVSDFPRGDRGLGINTSGATDFTTGEGHVYAFDGAGRGFEWRYVKFTLSEDATVNVAVNANATTNQMWVSFCDATVQTDNEANISLIAYNIALNDAKTAIGNDSYVNVAGSEKTALQAAIDADESLDKTSKEAIDAAKATLVEKTAAFTGAKTAYDAYVAAKAVEYTDDQPYASTTKFAAIETAQGAGDATSASDAVTKTYAIVSAYRKYVESNALAEGVDGATQIAISDPNLEVTYDSKTHTFGAWAVIGQTNGDIQLLDNQSFTDGDGNSNYKYADIYKKDNNAGIQQTINLQPGRYLLTVTARANTTSGAGFRLFADDNKKEISRIGNTGGTFDRGWDDTSLEFTVTEAKDVNIGVQSYNGKDLWWSATRFRLVRLGNVAVEISENADYTPTAATSVDVTLTRTVVAGLNTLVLPFDLTQAQVEAAFGEGSKVYTVDTEKTTAESVYFASASGIEANMPVLLEATAASTCTTFTGVNIEAGTPTVDGTVQFVGSYNASTTVATNDNNYVLSGGKLYLVDSDEDLTMKGTRAYFHVAAGGGAKSIRVFFDGHASAIDAVSTDSRLRGQAYDLSGRAVQNPTKGLYILNGKKIMVK